MKESFKQYKILSEELVYGGYFRLKRLSLKHTLYEGGWSPELDRELFRRDNCVALLPYDPVLDQVVLVEQFRVGAVLDKPVPWLLEIVAGAIEPGERPGDVACREAREEAGCEVLDLIPISEFYTSPGASSEKLTLYCGRVDARGLGGIHGLQSEHEDIFVSVVDFDEAMEKVKNGQIDSAIPIIALQWLALNRDWVREQWR
ncbi:MAG: NUDIX domain-containing protein [Methylococcaceae bacterium]|nr:NUDIX domain-containing protein [Methylococcaceae bacterium]